MIRLRSSDVVHGFSIPDLGIGPIEVYPGQETVVRLRPDDLGGRGELGFRCTRVCGRQHKHMAGTIVMIPRPRSTPIATRTNNAYGLTQSSDDPENLADAIAAERSNRR